MAKMAKSARGAPRGNLKKRSLGLFVLGMGLLLLGLAALVALPRAEQTASRDQPSAVPMAVSRPAPALTLQDLNGQAVSLDQYRGQVLLVNTWATWCPPCRAEMPTLEAYFQAHRHQNFALVAINDGEAAAKVIPFVRQMGLSFPVWLDPAGKAGAAFNIPGLPSSYVIDQGGTIRLAWTGAISQAMLEKYVTPLLEE